MNWVRELKFWRVRRLLDNRVAEHYRWRYWALLAAAKAAVREPSPENVSRLEVVIQEVSHHDVD